MNRTRTLSVALLAALAVLVAAGCGSGGSSGSSVPSDAVAVVDGTTITKSEFDQLIARAKISYQSQSRKFPKVGTPEYQSLQSSAATYLVRQVENDKEANKLGISVSDAEISARIEQIKKQLGGEAKFQAELKKQGYTSDELKHDVRTSLISEKIYNEVTKGINVTTADARKYYTDNPGQYQTPERRTVRHILVKTKSQAISVRARLISGGSWAVLAKKYSIDPGSKNAGGKLTIAKGQTVPAFEAAAFSLKTNQISQPVHTQFGFHVIEPISSISPASTTPFAQVEAQIKTTLLSQKKQAAVDAWTAKTTKSYQPKIRYAAGYQPATTTTATTTTG